MSPPPVHRAIAVVRRRQLSPRAFRMVTATALWVMVAIIVSGAAVRLTGSGLGCPDWPSCTATRVVAPLSFHPWVEFANRLINAGIGVVALVAVGAALVRVRRRRDLTWLSVGLVVGVLAEIVLGGITVKEKLAPELVSAHFVLAVLFLVDALILHHRAGIADEDILHRGLPLVSRPQRLLARSLLVAASVVVVLGTVVTSTGPHGGDPKAQRFHLSLHHVAQVHATAVEVFVGLTVITLWAMARAGVATAILRRGELLLVLLVVQGLVGYMQYATGDPGGLVEVHVAGAVAVVMATVRFNLALTRRVATGPLPAPESDPTAFVASG